MSKIIIRSCSEDTTRERILKSAILRFSAHSYEATGLRDLAADVGVDISYVHRCFGSKENLFREAIRAVAQPERLFGGDGEDLGDDLAKEILAKKDGNEVRPLDIIIHSFSSPDASRVLHDLLLADFIAPLTRKREGVSDRQAALIAGFMMGVGILKDVIGAEPLLGSERALVEIMARTIEEILSGGSADPCRDGPSKSFTEKQSR